MPLGRRAFLARLLATAATTAAAPILAACRATPTVAPSPGVEATGPRVTVHASPPAAGTPAGTAVAIPAGVAARLRARAIPLATLDPDASFADLAPLRALIGDARIVALGEATHGTHEFRALHHRLLAFLVRELGFTTFAPELSWPDTLALDAYARGGGGDAAALVASERFYLWSTAELAALLDWLRAHNGGPGAARPVRFAGIDMAFPDAALARLLDYVGAVDPAGRGAFADRYAGFRPYADNPAAYSRAPAEARAREGAAVRAAHEALLARREEYAAASSPAAFAEALQLARVITQAEAYYAAGGVGSPLATALRDRFMAENAGWLLERDGPGGRILLQLHNNHAGTAPYATPYGDAPGVETAGTHLRRRHGDALVTIGLTFGTGACNANGWERATGRTSGFAAHPIPPPPDGSYEAGLARVGLPRFLLDLRAPPGDAEAASWLAGPRPLRIIGTRYDPAVPERFLLPQRLAAMFDILAWIGETTPTRLLPFR